MGPKRGSPRRRLELPTRSRQEMKWPNPPSNFTPIIAGGRMASRDSPVRNSTFNPLALAKRARYQFSVPERQVRQAKAISDSETTIPKRWNIVERQAGPQVDIVLCRHTSPCHLSCVDPGRLFNGRRSGLAKGTKMNKIRASRTKEWKFQDPDRTRGRRLAVKPAMRPGRKTSNSKNGLERNSKYHAGSGTRWR